MNAEAIIEEARTRARAWLTDEFKAREAGDLERARTCHQGAVVLEQFARDLEAKVAA